MNFSDRSLIYLRDLEFRLPFWARKSVAKIYPRIKGDPWRLGERELGVIFTHIPKSAGTSITKTLFDVNPRHIPLSRYAAYDFELFSHSFKFTFVRNPWSRLHSAYFYLKGKVGMDPSFPGHRWAGEYLGDVSSFESFVNRLADDKKYFRAVRRYMHFRDQVDWVSIPGRGLSVDYIGRFETLDSDFSEICSIIDVKASLKSLRRGSGRSYVDDYTDRMIDIVGSIYAKDVKSFSYDFYD